MMTKEQITNLCAERQNELLSKYFGNLVHEAAYERPEEIDECKYSPDLPRQIASECYDFLKQLLSELRPGSQEELSAIMNKKARVLSFMADDSSWKRHTRMRKS